jgi:spermidine synthase
MYHVIGTGITAVLLYIISYFFYRINYFSYQFHKKLWNALLAIAFIGTAAAGVFMALQITYKWDLPFVKTILKWHVEFGIGMAITGLFHFIWHLSYFARIFEKQPDLTHSPENHKLTSSEIRLNLFIIGLVSSSVQLLLLREMLNIAGGYELITGIFLGSWLIGSSFGANLAASSKLTDLKKINLIFSLSPVFSISMMFFLSRMFLNTGETPSLLVSLIYTFLVLLPFCMVSGFTFVKLISFARSGNDFAPGKSFSIETIGGVVSGILISLLTAGILNTYQLFLLVLLLSVSYVLLFYYLVSPAGKMAARIVIFILASGIIVSRPDLLFRQILLPGITVTGSEDTPYGNITYGEYNGEQSTYYNQRLLAYNSDVAEREENIHYAMLQSTSPDKVILISGSFDTQLKEIMKYPVREVVYIERDPALVRSLTSLPDTLEVKLSVVNDDAFRYIRKTAGRADVIILSVPPPSTLQLNRYYTTEFFGAVKNKLNIEGIFMCSPGQGNDYFNKESLDLYSSIYNSLSSVFRNVKPVVGNKLYFIASDKELSVSFCQLTELKKINNLYVSPDFLSDDLIAKKTEELTGLMNRGMRQNKSSFPIASYHFQAYNFSKYMDEKAPLFVILSILFAAPLLLIKRRHMLMYFSASALAGFEIIILLTIQIIIGNMYQLTGLVLAGLMAGLAIGSGAKIKALNSLSLVKTGIILLMVYLLTGVLYSSLISLKNEIPALGLIIISAFIPALLTGQIFQNLTVSRTERDSASSVYSADLAGSALGFILVTAVAIPAFGIKASIFLLSSLIFAGVLFGTVRNKL